MVKVYANLTRYQSVVRPIDVSLKEFSIEVSKNTVQWTGIDTPAYIEPLMPTSPNNGLLGDWSAMVWKAVTAVTQAIIFGAIGAWQIFAGFMDTIFTAMGYPGFITEFGNFAITMWGYAVTLITSGFLFSLIVTIMSVFTNTLTFLFFWSTQFLNTLIQIITIALSIIDDTYAISTGVGDLWVLINFNLWVGAVPIFAIIWWFDSLDKRGQQIGWMTAFFHDIGIMIDVMSFIIFVITKIIDTVVSIVFGLINAIPVVE